MRRKNSVLFVTMMLIAIGVQAQSVRNPLNVEPASIRLYNGVSPKKISGLTFYRAGGQPFDRTNFVYGENGRKIAEQNQRWNERGGVWIDVSKNDYSYGEKVMTVVSDVFALNSRKNPSKTESYYDDKGKKIYSLSYKWKHDAEDWAGNADMKGSWIYDDKGHVVEYLKTIRNKTSETWDVPVMRIHYIYDEAGNRQEELLQTWDKDSESWTNRGKYVYIYNINAGEVVCMSYVASGDDWVCDGKIICMCDGDGDIVRCEYYNRDAGGAMSAYCIYTYSGTEKPEDILASVINTYPNPAVSYFDLTVPEEFVGETALLFDVSGRQKKSVIVNNTRLKVDVSDLSTGIYFIKIASYTNKIYVK
ncbi:MAG: T9SS type A sorting domain-containing protein [Tannerella sp.]|jgi:hypothetical protein|nr:T9SS type A sorting domain-containing protein [Tannerella sp.]